MSNTETFLAVSVMINAPARKIWECFTEPHHIKNWNFATAEWSCPSASLDLTPGGKFSYRMEAIDGSMGFDMEGEFIEIIPNKKISYKLSDGRQVVVEFREGGSGVTEVTEHFEPENENSREMQKAGWQSILDNFKQYCEKGH